MKKNRQLDLMNECDQDRGSHAGNRQGSDNKKRKSLISLTRLSSHRAYIRSVGFMTNQSLTKHL